MYRQYPIFKKKKFFLWNILFVVVGKLIDSISYTHEQIQTVRDIMADVNWMDSATWFENMDECVCIIRSDNTLEKSINPTILPPAMVK